MATVLILNIAKVYTMELDQKGNSIIRTDAFIALHHDSILMIGQGDYQSYIDKDTRIINAAQGIVIPGFIDLSFKPYPLITPWLFETKCSYDQYYQEHPMELQRDMHSLLFQTLRNGITTFAYDRLPSIYEEQLDSFKKYWLEYYKLVDVKDALSCHYNPIQYPCIDPLQQARRYVQQGLSAMEVLKRMTCIPASYLKGTQIGTLQVGKQADMLILDGSSIEYVLHQVSQHCLRAVIKKGTQQYPTILI